MAEPKGARPKRDSHRTEQGRDKNERPRPGFNSVCARVHHSTPSLGVAQILTIRHTPQGAAEANIISAKGDAAAELLRAEGARKAADLVSGSDL